MPRGDGYIAAGPGGTIGKLKGNQLVRTRNAYFARGFAVLVVDADVNLARAVDYMAAIKRPVTVVATKQGHASCGAWNRRRSKTGRTCPDLRFPDRWLRQPPKRRKYPWLTRVIATHFVIAHRHDSCRFTLPAGVEPFIRWAGGKAGVKWLDGGIESGDPCQARGHHGFNGLDVEVVSAAAEFH